jgi:hypothetical protein
MMRTNVLPTATTTHFLLKRSWGVLVCYTLVNAPSPSIYSIHSAMCEVLTAEIQAAAGG